MIGIVRLLCVIDRKKEGASYRHTLLEYLFSKGLELWASCNERLTCLVGGIFSKVLDEADKGTAFFANKQVLCAFAHAAEVNVRENQRIRRWIVHEGE